MKADIHPAYGETTVVCGCGNTFQTRSTKENGHIVVEVCSQCHPFYTGKQKILDSGGRVARFERRYGKRKAGAEQEASGVQDGRRFMCGRVPARRWHDARRAGD
jgi:large subunit ribosomal protein L31